VPAAMAPSASRCDGASATIAPATTTSTAARTKGTGQEQGRTRQIPDQKSVPSACPAGKTHGLSWLLRISRNRCSTAVPWACHVVPKHLDKYSTSSGPRLRDDFRTTYKTGGSPRERVSRRALPILRQAKSPHAIAGRPFELILRSPQPGVCRVANMLVVSSLVSSIYVHLRSSAFKSMWRRRS
jgi:hypothetical protein